MKDSEAYELLMTLFSKWNERFNWPKLRPISQKETFAMDKANLLIDDLST
jgi:hypothetical protein